jgi:hypothetical protein
MHHNLFAHVESPGEVYRAMQDHMKRDNRITAIVGPLAWVCFALALKQGPGDGWPWLVGGIAASFLCLNYFVDNSNRNFMLHTIDWIEATKSENKIAPIKSEAVNPGK